MSITSISSSSIPANYSNPNIARISGANSGGRPLAPLGAARPPHEPPKLSEEAEAKLTSLAKELGFDNAKDLGRAAFEAHKGGDKDFLSTLNSASNKLFGQDFKDALGIKPPTYRPHGAQKPDGDNDFDGSPVLVDQTT